MPKSPRKLRNILVNKRFQLSILAYFIFLSLVLILIFYISTIYLFGTLKLRVYAGDITDKRELFTLLEGFSSNMNTVFFLTSSVSIIVTGVLGLYLSHRIAGPVYRLGKLLNEKKPLSSFKELHFRKHDFFPELEIAFNTFLRRVKGDASKPE